MFRNLTNVDKSKNIFDKDQPKPFYLASYMQLIVNTYSAHLYLYIPLRKQPKHLFNLNTFTCAEKKLCIVQKSMSTFKNYKYKPRVWNTSTTNVWMFAIHWCPWNRNTVKFLISINQHQHKESDKELSKIEKSK